MPRWPNLMHIPEELIDGETVARFYSYTEKQGSCLIWTGRLFESTGYGAFYLANRTYRALGIPRNQMNAHRVHMLLSGHRFTNARPFALHCCPCLRKDCVELRHLYAGTAQENMIDRSEDGQHNARSGDDHSGAVLKESEINDIRTRLFRGEYVSAIAADYGCSEGAITNIKYGTAWKKVPVIISRNRRLGNYQPYERT